MDAGEVTERVYFAGFNNFDFQFVTSFDAVEISAWGKDEAGNLVAAHRLVAAELDPIGLIGITGAAGATGATGATGEGLAAYGYVYELATVLDATVVGGADISFSNNGPLLNIAHTPGASTVTVATSGTYQIDYSVSITAGLGDEIAIAVNGVVDPSTPVPALLATGQVVGQAILPLTAGDVVTLRNNSAVALTSVLAPNVGAQMTMARLD